MIGMSRNTYLRAGLMAFGAVALVLGAGGDAVAQGESETFEFDGGEAQSYTVPAGVCSLRIRVATQGGGYPRVHAVARRQLRHVAR
jgi:hypothetical protein